MKSSYYKVGLVFTVLWHISSTILGAQTSNISGIINIYTPVTATGPCPNQITVNSSTGFSAGNTVLIIQMQGATIDQTNTAAFGTVTSYNNCGLFEKAVILSVNGNQIYFTNDLVNSYTAPAGKVQMILVPQYVDVNVNGTLSCQDWDGTTGGVLVFDASGTITLNASVDVSGKGFRGGADIQVCPNSCNFTTNESAYFYPTGNYRGARKGEGIAEFIPLKELGRGAQANGGGGGNDHNNGGGGGGNFAAGGRGGNNSEPGAFNCKGNNNYGVGGYAINFGAAPTRLFLGGGGGTGHGNNGTTGGCAANGNAGPGGDGGGIVMFSCNSFNGNGQLITARGSDGGYASADGAGGAGAGGVICMKITSGFGAGACTINARGATGGNADANLGNRCYGPGGGGGGGAIFCNLALPGNFTAQVNGGSAGLVVSSTNACNNTSTTALAGSNGSVITSFSIPQGTVPANGGCNPLPVSLIEFSGHYNGMANELTWVTASEINNEGFEIERSMNCIEFTLRGFEPGHGNSNMINNYTYLDLYPEEGHNYYRLKQIDFDGNFAYSPIIAINSEAATDLYIYPNPGTGMFNIGGVEIEHAKLSVANNMGQCVYSGSITSQQFDLSYLNAGVYQVTIELNGQLFRKKLTIQ